MASIMETVSEGVLRLDKPKGVPSFCGWHGRPLAVAPEEYERRLAAVQAAMVESSLDLLVVKSSEDVRYLTGFHTIGDLGPQSLLVRRDALPLMVARLLEVDLVVKRTWLPQVWSCPDAGNIQEPLKAAMQQALGSCGGEGKAVVGLQLDVLSASGYRAFEQLLPGLKLQDASKTVEHIRLCKSAAELDSLARAVTMGEAGMLAGLAAVRRGVLLSELFTTALTATIAAGSEEPAYLPIVRSTDPSGHGSWEVGERVTSGLVFLELAASVGGHHSPLMRTAYVLSEEETAPPDWVGEAESLINAVFQHCLPLMVPGALARDIDRAARRIMSENTFGAHMVARVGYTAGGTATTPTGNAGWGDADFSLVGNNPHPLREGMVFHFIPWLQKYNGPVTGPIGLSDAVVVTAHGGRRLGTLPLRIQIVGGSMAGQPGPPPVSALNYAFVSDNASGACPEILEAIQRCSAGFQPAYELDAVSQRAKAAVKAHVGEAEVYFLATGTAANTLAVASVTRTFHAVLCGQNSHMAKDECGAPEKQTGCKLLTIPEDGQGKLTVAGIEQALAALIPVPHRSQPRVVCISQSTEVGTLYTLAELKAITDLAHQRGMLVHMDGARIFNACVALGVTLKEMTLDVGIDMLSLGGTKNGLANAEAVIFFNPQPDFGYIRKQGMQLLSKMRFVSSQFEALLSSDLWQRNASHANRMAKELGNRLQQLPGASLRFPVQTNMCFLCLPPSAVSLLQKRYCFLASPQDIRLVSSFATTQADVEELVKSVGDALGL